MEKKFKDGLSLIKFDILLLVLKIYLIYGRNFKF